MTHHFDHSPYTKKAFELSYALLRLAEFTRDQELCSRLSIFAHQLLEVFSNQEYQRAENLIEKIGWFIHLWTELSLIPKHLGESLLQELGEIKKLAFEAHSRVEPSNFKDLLPDSNEPLFSTPSVSKDFPAKQKKEHISSLPDKKSVSRSSYHYDSSKRQEAIIDFFRSRATSSNTLPVCRIKDVQDKFSDVSERTLRYDLQKLVEENLLERVGAGPMSAYRLVGQSPRSVTSFSEPRYNNQPVSSGEFSQREGTGKIQEDRL